MLGAKYLRSHLTLYEIDANINHSCCQITIKRKPLCPVRGSSLFAIGQYGAPCLHASRGRRVLHTRDGAFPKRIQCYAFRARGCQIDLDKVRNRKR